MFLGNVPLYKIKEIAYQSGFDRKGNMAIDRVLANPVYAGLVKVEPFKDSARRSFSSHSRANSG